MSRDVDFFRFTACYLDHKVVFPKSLKPQLSKVLDNFRTTNKVNYLFKIKRSRVPKPGLAELIHWSDKKAIVAIRNYSTAAAASAVATFLARVLAEENGLLIHGCLLAIGNKGYVFIGPSGAGKSTIAKNSTDAFVVSDDICALRFVNGRWMACGIPMLQSDGKISSPLNLPLEAVYNIQKSKRSMLKKTSPTLFFHLLISQTMIPFEDPSARRRVYNTVLKLVDDKKANVLLFRKDFNAVEFFRT